MFLCFIAYQEVFLISHYFTRNGIDSSVTYHLLYGLQGAGYGEYRSLIFLVVGSLVISLISAYLMGRWIAFRFKTPDTTKIPYKMCPYGMIIIGLSFSPTTYDLLQLSHYQTASPRPARLDFAEHYNQDGVSFTGRGKPRNLLFIYAESLERGYFDRKIFPGLINELHRLETLGTTFTNIEELPQTGWTIAGITASQCGIPLVTPSHGNSMSGMDLFLPGANCFGDYLAEFGYSVTALNGSSIEFAGLDKFFATHGFDSARGGPGDLIEQSDDPDYINPWGLYDDSLFRLAEQSLKELDHQQRPYALFLSTMDTHHPNGHRSATCEGIKYTDGSNPMLNAVACADWLISNFVNKVVASEYANNLVIVVASDHLAMGNTATSLLDRTIRRNFFVVIEPEKKQAEVTSRGSMLDVSSTLLPFLGFDGSIGLGRNLLREQSLLANLPDFKELLIAWTPEIMKLWEFPRIDPGDFLYVDAVNQTVKIKDRDYAYPVLITTDKGGDSTIRFNFNSSSMHKSLSDHLVTLNKETPFIWIDDCKLMAPTKKPHSEKHCIMSGITSIGNHRMVQLEGTSSFLIAQLYHPDARFDAATGNERQRHALDPHRFIAHAGGVIDGHTYTNSLEALNNSHAKGFRLFELDIILTSDGEYVAAHDWEHWRTLTGFSGDKPPSRSTFMQQSILQQYTPLDMQSINNWFSTHPEAILVTDKVNEPAHFASLFTDKSRLMMELFSVESLREGLEAGIASAMPTGNLLIQKHGLSPNDLKSMGVTSVAASRRLIEENLPLLRELASLDINVYAFHINFDEGKDEAYAVCHDMKFIYGIYADDYSFARPVICK